MAIQGATRGNGRLTARPNAQKNLGSTTTGLRRTGLETDRDGYLYVPESFKPHLPSPLVIMLHKAGGDAQDGIDLLRDSADRTGTILLVPESQGTNWDLLVDGLGTDIDFINEALIDVFALYPIDQKRVAIAGFSDGASWALTLGAVNADLFSHVFAFSPKFAPAQEITDSPRLFISHGVNDDISPIDRSSRPLVEKLRDSGQDVDLHEFEGSHTAPPEIVRRAFSWFLGTNETVAAKSSKVRSAPQPANRPH